MVRAFIVKEPHGANASDCSLVEAQHFLLEDCWIIIVSQIVMENKQQNGG